MDWDTYHYKLAETVKTKSKDPSTKVGCVIVGQSHHVLSTGFNGFPIGVFDDEEKYSNRETKYKYTVHAEANAICLAARHGISLVDSILYCTLFPCTACAGLIIQAGISRIVAPFPIEDRLNTSFNLSTSYDIFCEASIELVNVNDK